MAPTRRVRRRGRLKPPSRALTPVPEEEDPDDDPAASDAASSAYNPAPADLDNSDDFPYDAPTPVGDRPASPSSDIPDLDSEQDQEELLKETIDPEEYNAGVRKPYARIDTIPKPAMPTHSDNHETEAVNPYIKEDLKYSKSVSFNGWIEAVTNVSEDQLLNWVREIKDLGWFEDNVIQKSLQEFCAAGAETGRYDPFAQMANRILELAPVNLSGDPKKKSYPLDNIHYVNSSQRRMAKIAEHGKVSGDRKPDILVLSGRAVESFERGDRPKWAEVLHWWELKYTKKLMKEFDSEIQERSLPALAVNSDGQYVPRPTKAAEVPAKAPIGRRRVQRSTNTAGPSRRRRSAQIIPEVPDDPSTPIRAGMKRPAGNNILDKFGQGIQVKEPRTSNDPEYSRCAGAGAAIQSGSYALEALSCTYGTRLFSFGVILKDDKLSLWYYDASGIIYTREGISLIHDFEQAAAFIVALAMCTPEHLGAVPSSAIRPSVPYARKFPPSDLRKATCSISHPSTGRKVRLTLQDPLFTQYCLAGRRTFIYSVKASPAVPRTDLIAKFSYQVCTRKPEHELLAVARKAKVKHLPQIHMWGDLWKLSEGKRRVFYAKSNQDDNQATYEDRALRVIVYTKYASIKDLFSERCELIPVMVDQMLDCLHDLRYDANMLHRDISLNNIMFQIRQEKYWFILIDFDMAVVLPQDPESSYVASSKHRTGTLPFMACELVKDAWRAGSTKKNKLWKPIRHRLRHDFESLFWVALWCVLTLLSDFLSSEDAADILEKAHGWEVGGDLWSISTRKKDILEDGFDECDLVFADCAQCLRPWFEAWLPLFDAAKSAVKRRKASIRKGERAPFDDETAGGVLSRDALKKVLTPLMPFRQTAFHDDELTEELPGADVQGATENAIKACHGPVETPKTKRRARKHVSPEETAAARASILSRLRPRRKP